MHIFCDFDGTISIEDATDYILNRFADKEWENIEEQWRCGHIGSAQCMERQIALIHASRQELNKALDEISIDPTFAAFIGFTNSIHIPVTVISDGVDCFIKRILARYNIDHLPVIANSLKISGINGHTEYRLHSPYIDPLCASASGVCKCRAVSSSDIRIYIGDGRSDFCVSDKPDIVFAKGRLATYCADNHINFIPYHDFTDITHTLRRLLPATRRDLAVFEQAVA